MKNQNIVIFGATGKVGSFTAIGLKKKGFNVIAVGKRHSDNGFFESYGIPYFSIDISKADLFNVLPQSNVSSVIHLAGAMPAKMEGYQPHMYFDSIIYGTFNVLEYMKRVGCQKIIFSQSISDILYLFGTDNNISPDVERRFPLTGDHSVYSISKNTAVDLIEHYFYQFGIKRFILRLPTIYSYLGDSYYFVNGIKKHLAYRLLIEQAVRGEDIEVWGNPNSKKEIVYIKDLFQIIELSVLSQIDGGVYNVGTGIGVSLEDQINGIIDVFSPEGKKSKKIYRPEKPSSPNFILDISKTRNDLGYTPKYDYMSYLADFKNEISKKEFERLFKYDGR